MRVSVEEELLGDAIWENVEEGLAGVCQVCTNILTDISLKFTREKFVDLSNENSHLRNELDKSFGYEDDTVVLSKLSTTTNDVSDVGSDLLQGLILGLDLLTDENAVDAGTESTLEGNVRSRSAHEPDEMVVISRRYDIRAQVSDSF